MKKLFLLLAQTLCLSGLAQEGLHYQWHSSGQATQLYQHNTDTVYRLSAINQTSNNTIGVFNLKTESWEYLKAPGLNLNLVFNSQIIMRNALNGIVMQGGTQCSVTADAWQTATSYTLPNITSIVRGNKFGYIAYSTTTPSFNTLFSSTGASWTPVHTTTVIPQFSGTKDKVYTIHANLLKVSINGGASFTPVNATYTVDGLPLSPNDDTLYVASNVLHRSFDGGVNWTTTTFPVSTRSQIVCKNGRELMYIDEVANPKKIYYSNNSGTSWTTYTNLPPVNGGERLMATSLKFFLFPGFESVDGSVWYRFLESAPATKPYDITITDKIVVAAFSQGYFGYSTNKGFNFRFSPSKVSANFDLMAAKAADINMFYAADRKGQIFTSSDQGQTWTQKVTSTFNNIPRKFSISNNKTTVVMSAIGSAYVSFDSGSTFAFLNTTVGSGHYQTIKPSSAKIVDVAPLVATPSFTQVGFEIYEFNGTNTPVLTSSIAVNVAQDIVDVKMVNDNLGYLLTRKPSTNETVVYKTTNGWLTTASVSAIASPTASVRTYDGKYGNINCFGTDTIIISGSGDPINNKTDYYHVSIDGGLTWTQVFTAFLHPNAGFGNRVYKLDFFNTSEFVGLISGTQCGGIQASQAVYMNAKLAGASGSSAPVAIEQFSDKKNVVPLQVFPNPSSDWITLALPESKDAVEVSIVSLNGAEVYNAALPGGSRLQLNINELASGVYVLKVNSQGYINSCKLIKQ